MKSHCTGVYVGVWVGARMVVMNVYVHICTRMCTCASMCLFIGVRSTYIYLCLCHRSGIEVNPAKGELGAQHCM